MTIAVDWDVKPQTKQTNETEEYDQEIPPSQINPHHNYMGLVVRHPVFRVSTKESFKPVFSATETIYTDPK